MKKFSIFGVSLLAVAALSSCADTFNPAEDGEGEGRLMLKATINSDVKIKTRAGQTNDELAKSTVIWISNAGGAVCKYNGIDEVPTAGIKLLSGRYVAEAWAGDSVSADWEKRYFTGREEFAITKGSATQVNIECKIANTLVSVELDDNVKKVLNNITFEVGHDKSTGTRDGVLVFDQDKIDSGAKAYFMTNSRSKNLVYTLRGTLATTGEAFEKAGVIEDVARATEYHVIVKHNDQGSEDLGGAWLTIEVDDTEVDVEDKIEITTPPAISGIGFNIAEPVTDMIANFSRRSVWITSITHLASVEVRSDAFNSIADFGGNDFEIFKMSDRTRQILEEAGINYTYTTHDDSEFSELRINFEKQYLNTLPEGDYSFNITVTDDNGRTSTATLRIIPTMSLVMIQDFNPESPDITSRSAVITGTVLRDEATNCGIMYRAKGTLQWTKVAGKTGRAVGDTFTAVLEGLTPATTYELSSYCDNFESTQILTFTTEGESQLPNAGFEDWCTDPNEKNVVIPGVSPSDFFWDSGNHGSITMSKNITNKADDLKHSGNYSAKLMSQFVGMFGIGKFAAGNIFIGKYVATDGTDGILGWGRPFSGRPTAMRVWVKYTPAAVDRVDASNSDGVVKGDMDRGIIYIALLDNTKTSVTFKETEHTWPVIIKTKKAERQLFDKNGSNVVAYGEKVFTEATAGDGLVEFVIPIDYRRHDVRPSNIMVVASASKMGDYFTGGPSVMYVDDVELIYE